MMPQSATLSLPVHDVAQKRSARRAQISSFLGSTVEFYDFLLYGTAASLVFPHLFFAGVPDALALVLSYITLAIGYLLRPLGGIVFGHFGDRLGRKRMLVMTMLMMGISSVAVGLLPTAATIGLAAPILLVTCRAVQGFALGGEWAGAALMSMEHARPGKKGFAASIAVAGGPAGAVLATAVLGLFATLPQDQFMRWGWRIPFLLSALLVAIALFMRWHVSESPEFEAARKEALKNPAVREPHPFLSVMREHWASVCLSVTTGLAPLFMQSILATFVLTYAVQVGHPRADVLLMLTFANVLHIFTIPFFAALSDRFGRRQIILLGALTSMILIWFMFPLIEQDSMSMLLLALIIGNPIIQAFMYGPMGAYIGEMFPTRVRYTGLSLSYQLTTTFGAGFAPLIAFKLLQMGNNTTTYLTVFFCALCALTAISVLLVTRVRKNIQ
jgi:MFS family permease